MKLKSKLVGTFRASDGGKELVVNPGEEFEVSDARGELLLADYPDGFEVAGAKGKKAKE